MLDYLELGPVPANEECVQVGEDNYTELGKKECYIHKRQLERQFPSLPGEMRFGVKAFNHDFGGYYDVVIYFRGGIQEEAQMAYRIEREASPDWDEEASKELRGA